MKVKTTMFLSVACCIALLPMTITLADTDTSCITNNTPFTLHLKNWESSGGYIISYLGGGTNANVGSDNMGNYIGGPDTPYFDAYLMPQNTLCFKILSSVLGGGSGIKGDIYVEKQAYPVSQGSTTMRFIGSTYLLGNIHLYNPAVGSFDVDHSQPNNCLADKTYIRKSGFSANIYCRTNAC